MGQILGGEDTGASFGTDLLFTNGRLQLGSQGDYLTVTGDENLRRSIYRRFMTSPGEYKLNPKYGVGLPAFVKKPMTASNLDRLKHLISDNLSRDRRIDKIVSLELTPISLNGQTGLKITLAVKSKGQTIRFAPFTFTKGA